MKSLGIRLTGRLVDVAHFLDGSSRVIHLAENIVVDGGLKVVAGLLKGSNATGITQMAIGIGLPEWDLNGPVEDPGTEALVNEIYRKGVFVHFWDVVLADFSVDPTNVLDIRVTFDTTEGNADLREYGLIAGDGDTLFNYVIHGKITKTNEYNLERILRLTVDRV